MVYQYLGKVFMGCAILMALAACDSKTKDQSTTKQQPTSEQQPPDPNSIVLATDKQDLFAPGNILDIEIEMANQHWTALSYDGPQVSDWAAACVFDGYPEYSAAVTINGELIDNVSVRKKGWIGSLSVLRPSLKFDFDNGEGNESRRFHGLKRMTLNNNKQDPSNIKQCLSFLIFNRGGVHAPQCNFARVSAQGESLGLYSHVEPIKKPFLKRVFGDDDGNLYEAQRDGEFTSGRIAYFQVKTNEKENDQSDLEEILDALENNDDENLWSALEPLINLHYFIRFAALEALTGHTDGHTGFQNNTYLYHNPEDDLFYFIPWGTDQTFVRNYVTQVTENVPASIMQGSILAQRLWRNSKFRQSYTREMQSLLGTVWDESELKEYAIAMAKLLDTSEVELNKIVSFIDQRRELINQELATSNNDWRWSLMGEPGDCAIPEPVTGQFDTRLAPPNSGQQFSFQFQGTTYSGNMGAAGATLADGRYRIILNGVSALGEQMNLTIEIPQALWATGIIPFHSLETSGYAVMPDQAGSWQFLGLLTDGFIELNAAGSSSGALVTGSFDAAVVVPD